MLLYAVDTPRWATYYPLAEFSPEFQAFRWAAHHAVQVQLMDLPASAVLGLNVVRDRRSDAMEDLARAAGFDDGEDWWEHLVEQRANPSELFDGIEALFSALRESEVEIETESEDVPDGGRTRVSWAEFESMREAHMRRTLRGVLADGHERIAVVCGAWHVPALREPQTAKADDALLKGLPKLKVGASVVPWAYDRLTFASGYGAGMRSPAFYDLLWNTPHDEVPTRWLLSVARLMREEDLDASPASVIEAVRLADALASIRGRPRPGLRELREAAGSVLVRDEAIWNLIGRRLIVGEQMGQVPESVPMVPLEADLAAQQKRLRMKPESTERILQLDLRSDFDLERSHLLHRLRLLSVEWGLPERVAGKKGTFHEHWRLQWRPELTISLIEASIYGNTVELAAANCAVEHAEGAQTLAQISDLIESVLLADLRVAVDPTVAKLQALSATGADIADLAAALPPLTAVVRYGSVRKTEADRVAPVLDAIFTRFCVGLPGSCVGLDDEAARAMARRIGDVAGVVHTFDDDEKTTLWRDTLARVANFSGCHPLIIGKTERLRFDLGAISGDDLALRLGQEASTGATALETAAFIEGLLDGPGTILLHQDALFQSIDTWVTELDEVVLDDILPLIRRTFSLFTKPERRQIGERVTQGKVMSAKELDVDMERANRVLPVIRQILGLTHE